jgi:hypothetical protein
LINTLVIFWVTWYILRNGVSGLLVLYKPELGVSESVDVRIVFRKLPAALELKTSSNKLEIMTDKHIATSTDAFQMVSMRKKYSQHFQRLFYNILYSLGHFLIFHAITQWPYRNRSQALKQL